MDFLRKFGAVHFESAGGGISRCVREELDEILNLRNGIVLNGAYFVVAWQRPRARE